MVMSNYQLFFALMNHDWFSIIIPICVLPDDPNFDIPRCFNSSKEVRSRFQAWEMVVETEKKMDFLAILLVIILWMLKFRPLKKKSAYQMGPPMTGDRLPIESLP